jgi:hypothetical protein
MRSTKEQAALAKLEQLADAKMYPTLAPLIPIVRAALASLPEQAAQAEPNNDEVICPACAHQFRAIPVNVQRLMLYAGFEPPHLNDQQEGR